MTLGHQLLLLPLLILLNAFFVAAEYALVALQKPQIHAMGERGLKSARWMMALRAHMASTLGGIQVCITMTNLLLGALGEPAMTQVLLHAMAPLGYVLSPEAASWFSTSLGFIVVTLATVVASELLPKALTLQHTILVARIVAGPLLVTLRVIWPLVWVMDKLANFLSRSLGLGPVRIEEAPMGVEEIKAVARAAGEHGSLGEQEQRLILNTLGMSELRASDVMVHRVNVACIDLRRSMEQNREIMERQLFSRLPLCDGGMDHVIGIVYTKEFLAAYPEGSDSSVLQLICRKAIFAPATISLDRLLALFLEQRCRMIVLVDETGGVDGVATLTDVMDRLLKGETP